MEVKTPDFLSWLSSDFLYDLWGLGVTVYTMEAGRSLFLILCHGASKGRVARIRKKQNNNHKWHCMEELITVSPNMNGDLYLNFCLDFL